MEPRTEPLAAQKHEGSRMGRGLMGDLALVGALLLWGVGLAAVSGVGAGFPLMGLLQVLPLFWRRKAPVMAALAVAAGCLLQVIFTDDPHPANVAVPVAVYSVAVYGSRAQSFLIGGLGLAGAVVAAIDWRLRMTSLDQQLIQVSMTALFMGMFVAVAWVLGDVVRRRKAVVARLQQQNLALARDQAQRSRLAAQDERAAIAREMHDVVAHSLAVVVVQADGALYAARAALDRPATSEADRAALQRAAQTLETLADTARSSLSDTRRLVGVLRDADSSAEFSPLQGLEHLDELVQRVQDSGITVHCAVRGEIGGLPAELDLAAYRVVQEGLTNVMKHAGPGASVDVDLLRSPAVLLVRVTDDGGRTAGGDRDDLASGDGAGNGLRGMAERVEVLGGTVHAGPRTTAGWEVVASIPVSGGGDPDLASDGIPSDSAKKTP